MKVGGGGVGRMGENGGGKMETAVFEHQFLKNFKRRYTQTKSKGLEKDILCKWKRKKSWGSRTYIQQNKAIVRDKQGHYKRIKGTVQHEDLTLVNIYAPN